MQLGEVLAHGEGENVSFGAPRSWTARRLPSRSSTRAVAPRSIAFKKRRRQNSRRKRGHRQLLTTVRISEILARRCQKPSKKAAAKPAPKKKAKDESAETQAVETTAAETKATETKSEAKAAPKKADKKAAGDDLTAIKGIGPKAAEQLNEQGIVSYADLAGLTDERIAEIDAAMPFSDGPDHGMARAGQGTEIGRSPAGLARRRRPPPTVSGRRWRELFFSGGSRVRLHP